MTNRELISKLTEIDQKAMHRGMPHLCAILEAELQAAGVSTWDKYVEQDGPRAEALLTTVSEIVNRDDKSSVATATTHSATIPVEEQKKEIKMTQAEEEKAIRSAITNFVSKAMEREKLKGKFNKKQIRLAAIQALYHLPVIDSVGDAIEFDLLKH